MSSLDEVSLKVGQILANIDTLIGDVKEVKEESSKTNRQLSKINNEVLLLNRDAQSIASEFDGFKKKFNEAQKDIQHIKNMKNKALGVMIGIGVASGGVGAFLIKILKFFP